MAASMIAADIPISEQHAFLDCAKEFDWASVKRLVNATPALVGVQPCGRQGGRRWSALHQASFGGSTEAVSFLVKSGAPLDAKNDADQTPYEVAKNESIRSLLRAFAQRSPDDITALTAVEDAVAKTSKAKVSKAMKMSMKMMKVAVKAMKTKKAKKTMKVMKSKIAKGKKAKSLVWKGKFEKTAGGLTKSHLRKSKSGKIVSINMQKRGEASFGKIKGWVDAFMKARAELGLKGFVAIKKGTPLYEKTMEFYKS